MRRSCGCQDTVPFPVKCARARALEAQLCQAFREKDLEAARRIHAWLAEPHETLPAGAGVVPAPLSRSPKEVEP